MAKFSITMPDDMGSYIEDAMRARQFENTSEYFRHLVRQDQEREKNIAELRTMLDQAEASGVSKRKVPDVMKDVEKDSAKWQAIIFPKLPMPIWIKFTNVPSLSLGWRKHRNIF